jgi:hypothetical protein
MDSIRDSLRRRLLEDDAGDPPKTLKVKNSTGEEVLKYFYSGLLDNYRFKPDEVMAKIGGGDVEKGKRLFVQNFNKLKRAASGGGKPPRAWMPVIQPKNIPELVKALKSGDIDIAVPHAKVSGVRALPPHQESTLSVLRDQLLEADKKFNPTDIDLSGGRGQPRPAPDAPTFLKKGRLDKQAADDIVRGIKVAEIPVKNLKPSQDEVYGSKVALNMAKFGPTVGGKTAFGKPDIIVTSDNYILDGHHRWATAWAGDPSNKLKVTVIPLPLQHLYLVLRAYGAAIGNRQQA